VLEFSCTVGGLDGLLCKRNFQDNGQSVNMFSVTDLMVEAERETRLSDWGDDHFLQPFVRLIDSLNQEAELTEIGRQRSQLHLANLLAYRLRLVADRKLRPEIAQQQIGKPVFTSGMPRSGTSYLNALLARDPNIVVPLHWQMWLFHTSLPRSQADPAGTTGRQVQ
jgi:hypothetical protein